MIPMITQRCRSLNSISNNQILKHDTAVDIWGLEHPARVYYTYHPGYEQTFEEPGVSPQVEITSLLLAIGRDWIEMPATDEVLEELADEILEEHHV